jgi:hypothetical protein
MACLLLRMVLDVVAFVVGRGASVGSSRVGGSQIYLSARGCALVLSSLCFFDGPTASGVQTFLVDDKFASTAGHNSSEIISAPTSMGCRGMGIKIGAVLFGERPQSYTGRDPAVVNILLTKRSYG